MRTARRLDLILKSLTSQSCMLPLVIEAFRSLMLTYVSHKSRSRLPLPSARPRLPPHSIYAAYTALLPVPLTLHRPTERHCKCVWTTYTTTACCRRLSKIHRIVTDCNQNTPLLKSRRRIFSLPIFIFLFRFFHPSLLSQLLLLLFLQFHVDFRFPLCERLATQHNVFTDRIIGPTHVIKTTG